MAATSEVLRFQVLLAFFQNENSTVTGLARQFGEEKYTISRLLSALEEEGLLDRSNNRHPKLTSVGYEQTAGYAERYAVMVRYLKNKGIPAEVAEEDALRLAMHLSEDSMNLFRANADMEEAKALFRERRKFAGSEFFMKLPDGNYPVAFIIGREKANQITNVSMANEGFEHPALLSVTDGVGTLRLRMTTLNARSSKTGSVMKGKVNALRFFDRGDYPKAECTEDAFHVPTESFQFYNMRPGPEPLFHGILPIKVSANVGNMVMSESMAFLTVII